MLKRNLPEDKLVFFTKKEMEEPKELKESEEAEEEVLVIGDLDVENGLLYCGGREEYLHILEAYYEEKEEGIRLLSELFEKQDWTNYTIKVHALKSMMLNIGANPLSAKAKALEMAGKRNDIDYIMKNHEDMLTEYRRVMEQLKESPLLHIKADDDTLEVKETPDMPKLSESDFDEMFARLEDAAYALNGENMLALVLELQKYQYHQAALEEKLASVKKKVEMSDYMSALDALTHIREELRKEPEGGAGGS